jgi:hypothetical protein
MGSSDGAFFLANNKGRDIDVQIGSLPSVLQAELNLLHYRVKERLHVTANSFCYVSNGDKGFKKCGQSRYGGVTKSSAPNERSLDLLRRVRR